MWMSEPETRLPGRVFYLRLLYCYQSGRSGREGTPVIDSLETVLENVGWGMLISFLAIVIIWISPLGKLIGEFEEFRESKRKQGK